MNPEKFHALTGYQFQQPDLLQQALTHRSHSRSANNERLEFLGDSILNLIISSHIFERFGEASEGKLSRIRAALVREKCLASVARELGLGEYIYLGGGEMKTGGHRRASILADTMEAVIGAVFLDSDFIQSEKFVLHIYRNQLLELGERIDLKDPKTRLQEYLQGRKMNLPDYRVEKTSGKSHKQVFTVSCSLDDLELRTEDKGSSRKKAEQRSAQKMLRKLDL